MWCGFIFYETRFVHVHGELSIEDFLMVYIDLFFYFRKHQQTTSISNHHSTRAKQVNIR
jgi:hypothetical protein